MSGIIPFPILNSSLSFVFLLIIFYFSNLNELQTKFVVKIYLKNLEAEPTASCILRRNFSSKILCLNNEFKIGNGIRGEGKN